MPHFDPTISLGNIVTVLAFVVLAIVAWRDMNWRIKNLETWRDSHEHTAAVALENLSLLQAAVQEMRAIASGQERRIEMLEDRPGYQRHQ